MRIRGFATPTGGWMIIFDERFGVGCPGGGLVGGKRGGLGNWRGHDMECMIHDSH